MQPYFSIVVPVYNAKAFLAECLESLTGQTFSDYEIILVDDGSTDGSGALCDAWMDRFPDRIRVLHQPNQGVIMARSAGFSAARGQFLVSVDSDDILHKEALEWIHRYAEQYRADVVIYQACDEPDFSEPFRVLPFTDGEVLCVAESPQLRTLAASTFVLNSLWSKAFRRELVALQTEQTAHISQGEDLVYTMPVLDQAQRIVYCRRVLYYYRPNPGSITNSYKPSLFLSLRDAIRVQRSYAEKWDETGRLAAACDAHALWRFYDDVIPRLMHDPCSLEQKHSYVREMITDEDFIRDYAYIRDIPGLKAKVGLWLVRNNWLWPLYYYDRLKAFLGKLR